MVLFVDPCYTSSNIPFVLAQSSYWLVNLVETTDKIWMWINGYFRWWTITCLATAIRRALFQLSKACVQYQTSDMQIYLKPGMSFAGQKLYSKQNSLCKANLSMGFFFNKAYIKCFASSDKFSGILNSARITLFKVFRTPWVSKGGFPTSMVYSIQPTLHTSASRPWAPLMAISGEM